MRMVRSMVPGLVVVFVVWCRIVDGADLSGLDGEYDQNDTLVLAPGQTTLCTDEVWIDSSLNGDDDSILNASAIIFEDGSDPCEGAYFELEDATSINREFSLDYPPDYSITLRVVSGTARFGFMPLNQTLVCGKRELRAFEGIPAAFVWLQSGSMSITETITDSSRSVDLVEPTLFMIGEMQIPSVSSVAVPQGCVYSYDEPLPDDSVCFPSHAQVAVPCATSAGVCWKRMEDVEVGDDVLLDLETKERSTVFWFGHREPHRSSRFVRIKTTSGSVLTLSPNHLLYDSRGRQVRAGSISAGDFVSEGAVGNAVRVTTVSFVQQRGVYNPHTLQGTLIVNGVVVSCYTTLVSPTIAHLLLLPARFIFTSIGPHAANLLPAWNALHAAAPKRLLHLASMISRAPEVFSP